MAITYRLKDGTVVDLKAKVAVIDYETEYSDEFSVSSMSYWHYANDPRSRPHTVSIVSNTGVRWSGFPKDAPWESVRDHVWVSHNRPFDQSQHEALQKRGEVPAWSPVYWGDSMNLCAYIRAPRALAKAVFALYGIKLDKKIRDVEMKGKKWEEFSADLQKRIREYAISDGDHTLRLWMDHVHLWPSKEIRISDLIVSRGLRGVCIDREGAEADMAMMRRIIWNAEQNIPWRETDKILSVPALAAKCREVNIEPPASLDMKDEKLAEWEDKYGKSYPWVAAMRDWRRMNSLLKKYEMIVGRIKPDGRAEFSIRYMGTHTGRTAAGETGYDKERDTFNMLNLPREPFYVRADLTVAHEKADLKRISAYRAANNGKLPDDIVYAIDLRRKIIPGPGMKFVICDMAQIEARITNWLGRDKRTLDLIRQGYSVYDVHAITLMGYVPKTDEKTGKPKSLKKENPQMYALAKARELALGFNAGHERFIVMAPTYVSDEDCEAIFGRPITPDEEKWYLNTLQRGRQVKLLEAYPKLDRAKQVALVNSQIQVQSFRKAKAWLPLLWRRLDEELKRSIGGTHEIALPSGRVLRYFDVVRDAGEVKARVEINGAQKNFYGGKLLENTVQATARDVFVEGQLKLDDQSIDVILDIYDENVTEVPLDFPAQRVAEIMTQNPEWAKTLPLGAEVEESLFYKK